MKTMLLLLTLPLLALAQSTQPDMKWVDDEITAIKPPRKGVPANELAGLKDPFSTQIRLNQPKGTGTGGKSVAIVKPKPRPLTLEVVLNSRSAMIDGKWYKVDDKLYGYTIREIGGDNVLLEKKMTKQKKKQITLTLSKKNKNIKLNAK